LGYLGHILRRLGTPFDAPGFHVLDPLAWMLRFGFPRLFAFDKMDPQAVFREETACSGYGQDGRMNPVVMLATHTNAAFDPPNATALWPMNASNSHISAPQV
jgi:hypothetical protein